MTDHFGNYGSQTTAGGISADDAVAISTYVTDQALAPVINDLTSLTGDVSLVESRTIAISHSGIGPGVTTISGELNTGGAINAGLSSVTCQNVLANGSVSIGGSITVLTSTTTGNAQVNGNLTLGPASLITLNGSSGVLQATTIQSTGVLQSFGNFRVRNGAAGTERLFVNAITGDVSIPGALTPGSITTHSPTGLYDLFSPNVVIVTSDAQLQALYGQSDPLPGQLDTGKLYTLLPETTYIFKQPMTLTAGLRMANNTTIRGWSSAVGISFTNAVSPCIYSKDVDFYILDILFTGGAKLFNCYNFNGLAPPPFFGRNNIISLRNVQFLRQRVLGSITGYILDVRSAFFNGGGLAAPLTLTSQPATNANILVGTTYPLTTFGSGVGSGLAIKALSINVNGQLVTWQIVNDGIDYKVGETVENLATGLQFTVNRVYFNVSGLNNATIGVVGDSTTQGLNLISPRFVGMSESRFAAFKGVYHASNTFLMAFAQPLALESVVGAAVTGNTFVPFDTETGVLFSNGSNILSSTVQGNTWVTAETGVTTKNISYTPTGLYNSLSMRGWNFLNNTNVTNSSAYLTMSGNSNTVATLVSGTSSLIGVLPTGLDVTRLQRFSTDISLVWASSPMTVVAGYTINLSTNVAVNAYIIRVDPLVGLTQNIHVVNMTLGFIVPGASYQVRDGAGTIIPGTLPTISLLGGTSLTPYQANLERVAGGLYSVTANLQFSTDPASQSVVFNILQNSSLSGISTTTSAEQKNSPRSVSVSGILSLNPLDAISLNFSVPGVTVVGVSVSRIIMNIFPVG